MGTRYRPTHRGRALSAPDPDIQTTGGDSEGARGGSRTREAPRSERRGGERGPATGDDPAGCTPHAGVESLHAHDGVDCNDPSGQRP
eukprot:COSAG02_NODE_1834_length_10718_cov_3.893775_7_plen_87_part_00